MKINPFPANSFFGRQSNNDLIGSARDYLELCKWQITRTVVFTTALGYYLAHLHLDKKIDYFHFFIALLGIALVCAAACTVNHILEAKSDAKMSRTKARPIPNGSISETKAWLWAMFLFLFGLTLLWKYFSWQLAMYSLLTAILYDFVYTPLKKKTKWNTSIGAISGAWPIVGGWLAGGGEDIIIGWIIFFVLFFWQHPHFYAIAWMYRDDYQRAGYKMLPLDDHFGKKTFLVSILTSLPLLPLSIMLASYITKLGVIYLIFSSAAGLWFVSEVIRGAIKKTNRAARRIVLTSVLYIMLWFISIWMDQQISL